MAYRGRLQMRTVLPATLSKMSLVCGLMLVMLGLVSLLIVPLLDIDHSPRGFGLAPVLRRRTMEPMARVHKYLLDVPAFADVSPDNIWASKFAEFYYGCSSPSKSSQRHVSELESNGFILIETSGGLNQQRTGITDAVVVARMLNATMVIPRLDHKSFWKDSSNFSDIFDLDKFITAVAPDVNIVKELPVTVKLPRGKLISMRVPRKCTPRYYETRVLPVLRRRKAIRFTKFDYRLANKLDVDLQKLRCRVNYNALQFTKDIMDMGQALVQNLKQRSGRYIALHLRFEPDMLAFSGCYYGGGEKEIRELGAIRKRWKTLRSKDPDRQRRNGKCPLTPLEVGLMLRALGFGNDSHLYVASGEVYGGEQSLVPLKLLFPNFYTKDSMTRKNELQQFSSYSSRMAAIDYIVCDESDAFVTNNNGNMARILAGRRRYFGHKRTIRPNAKKLGSIFLARPNMTWDMFSLKVRAAQKGFMGEPDEIRPGRGDFFENPAACICENSQLKDKHEAIKQHRSKGKYKKGKGDYIKSVESQVHPEQEDEDDLEHTDVEGELEGDDFLIQHPDFEKEDNALKQDEDLEMEDIPSLLD
eukprot:c27201_g1_i1 orf=308-2065(-)